MSCNNNSDVYKFSALEVHTLHIRDFSGEKYIQSIGEERSYQVSTACAQLELQAVLFPVKRIIMKCLPFMVLVIIGLVLSFKFSLQDIMFAFRVIGPLCIFVGVSGIISTIRKILSERDKLRSMNHDEALRFSAWQCVLKSAPKKYKDNDITYIPIDQDTINMNTKALSYTYDLLPAISQQVFEFIHKR